MNYFELLEIPTNFSIDLTQLATHYRTKLKQSHPDSSVKNREQNDQAASAQLINQAYQTLKQIDLRAAHLLTLGGHDQGLDQSIHDLDFLQHALELREQLDDSPVLVTLDDLQQEVLDWQSALAREFELDLARQDWVEAQETVRKLKFMQQLLMDIDEAIDRVYDALDG